jgi:hypothetical protein
MLTSASAPAAARPFGLAPAAVLGAGRPHGDRLRYMAGCHCEECRRGNREYEKQRMAARRAGDWNGLVPAARAREHLLALRAAGVGRRQVSDASGVAEVIVQQIGTGSRTNIRARTERRILAVTSQAIGDKALVDAAATWKLLNQLLKWGYTKARLARELGYERPALQLGRSQVTARTAYDVERLHERLKCVPNASTAKRIQDLQKEGYRRSQIDSMVLALAAHEGAPPPDLQVYGKGLGSISAATANLVRRVHETCTGEPQ